ncbi:MAG: hypothetical protein PHW08_00450 [Kiritimatiellae bacterium]|nr:hypothetical protein [Kiritimatiellia bacterium]
MKRMALLIALSACAATAQDRLSRVGGFTGGDARKKTPESEARRASAESPIPISMTAAEFERRCLDAATQDAEDGARYIALRDGWMRTTGDGCRHVSILQRIGASFYLARSGDRTIAVRTLRDDYVDDTPCVLRLVETGEAHDYRTVLGAGARVAVYSVAPSPTRHELLNRFRAGEVFTIPIHVTRAVNCMGCKGTGFTDIKAGGGKRRGICPDCHGKRKIEISTDMIHRVTCSEKPKSASVRTPPPIAGSGRAKP